LRAELLRVKQDTLYFQRLIRDLAGFFGVAREIEVVVEARNRAASEDYAAYVGRLYADARLTTVVMDFGYPVPNLEVAAVTTELPVEVVPIYRIEPLIAQLLREELGWPEFEQRYDDSLADALTNGAYKGLKSIIAYRTGLDVSPLSRTRDQGYKALDAIRRGLGGGSMKLLRDHLLCRALELCMQFDVPMQIHTGMGDFEVNLVYARPSYLLDLLRFPVYRACNVILVHTGYPWQREAGYIANVLPRVYCDLSEGIPFAGHAARQIISEVLEMAPYSKVVYGSDGFRLPEINYTSAKLAKQALSGVLTDLVAGGMLTEPEAQRAAALILSGTARRLYRMD
jgi:hypothetical protein